MRMHPKKRKPLPNEKVVQKARDVVHPQQVDEDGQQALEVAQDQLIEEGEEVHPLAPATHKKLSWALMASTTARKVARRRLTAL